MTFDEWYISHKGQHILKADLRQCWKDARLDLMDELRPLLVHKSVSYPDVCKACEITKREEWK